MTFHPFRIDLRERRLWRGADAIDLKPKAFAVLAHLAVRAGRLVTFEDLTAEVWRNTFVSSATLRSTVREVRRALGDRPRSPRFIDTVHGRGYRFIAPTLGSRDGAETPHDAGTAPAPEPLAGRSEELERLHDEFAIASSGRRRLVLLTGEPGVGKSALAEEFLRGLHTRGKAVCAFGSCISGHGPMEPYLPILEALERLCRGPRGRRQQDLLERIAPMWMLALPGLVDPKTTRRLRVEAMRLDRDRMLLQLAHAVEALCSEEPLVLLLEDLHWSDPATLGAIELLARRTERARLLVVGTHRPLPAHSSLEKTKRLRTLRAELEPRGLCTSLEVSPLSFEATQAYVAQRFPALEDSAETVSEFLYARSEGNPLLFVACADALVQQGLLERTDDGWRLRRDLRELEIPPGLRQMLDYQLDHYSADDRELLERASVMGSDFDPYALQKSLSSEPDLDDRFYRIARAGGVIRPRGDGFTFVHELYREMLYERISSRRQRRLHQSIGERIEREHAAQTADVASSLAMHFERSGDTGRTIQYLRETATLAAQRSAHDEAVTLLRRAQARIGDLPRGTERDRTEFGVATRLGNALTLTRGYVAPEVRDVYDRAVALSEAIDDETPDLMTALAGLHGYYELRGEHAASTKIALRQLDVADRTGAAFDRVVASLCRGMSCFSVGNYDEAARQLTICIETYDREKHSPVTMQVATDHGASCLGYGSLVFGAVGRLDQARDWIARSLALARDLAHVPSIAVSLYYAMVVEQLLRHVDRADRYATECFELSMKHAFPYFVPATLVVSGWVMAQRGNADAGADQASRGLTILKDAGARLGQPLWAALLADACCAAGRFDEGLVAVEEGLAFVQDTGEVAAEPALHWMRGKLLWEQSGASEAEACLVRGVETARLRGAHTQALGPATLLAKIRAAAGRRDEAARGLTAALQPMTPAADVPLLTEAEVVLRGL